MQHEKQTHAEIFLLQKAILPAPTYIICSQNIVYSFVVTFVIEGLAHLARRTMFRITDDKGGLVTNDKTGLCTKLCQIDLLAEKKNGIVKQGVFGDKSSCQEHERPMARIDIHGRLAGIGSLAEVQGTLVQIVKDGVFEQEA